MSSANLTFRENTFSPPFPRFCIVIIRSAFTGAFYNVKGVPRVQSTRPVRRMDEINLKKLCHSMRRYFQQHKRRKRRDDLLTITASTSQRESLSIMKAAVCCMCKLFNILMSFRLSLAVFNPEWYHEIRIYRRWKSFVQPSSAFPLELFVKIG